MLYEMLKRDVTRFLLIFVLILMGFAHAFYIFVDVPTTSQDFEGVSFAGRLVHVAQSSFGIDGDEEYGDYTKTDVGNASYSIYTVVVTVVLINMLIAQMSVKIFCRAPL